MRKFRQNDASFHCVVCGSFVDKLKYTSRNHCPFCLHSLHVDHMPGDRANDCCGILVPKDLTLKNGKYQIVHQCKNCGELRKNIIADDDNYDQIISLAAHFL